ncbi:hypothetical protein GCM10011494_24510 [Novosphingobium endophyticum]|uniref:Microcin J25-processing protein McjB C-terminal domain-containing protein n=1 Tax=Novosphingobium endophyticum TaxID=1955250 RepID=A0A916TTK6_9SPHN|nr:lasso peptide biosynthesis B2 protein [Novosphingobium endophyticum]GGC05050.1 hypothetical protein GCM10011494_24510 [Novosphingobium endophyticum]
MGHSLRAGISYCDAGGRLIFLDVHADRYFCLAPEAEAAFRRLVAHPGASEAAAPGLLESGMLVRTRHAEVPRPFSLARRAETSLLDLPRLRASSAELLAALSRLALAGLLLRRRGLRRSLERLAAARPSCAPARLDMPQALQRPAAAFEMSARLVRSHDQCLPRSIALARHCAARGLAADLVIGVRLRPFAAHAWVQAGPWLLNDRLDTVRTYTPILAV